MHVVNLLTGHICTDSSAPGVDLIVILEPRFDDAVVVEILLHTNDVVGFLVEILSDACRTFCTRAIGIGFDEQNLLRQAVNIEGRHLELYCHFLSIDSNLRQQ